MYIDSGDEEKVLIISLFFHLTPKTLKSKLNGVVILKLCKLAINKSIDVPLTVGLDYERDRFAMCFGNEEALLGDDQTANNFASI